MKNGSLVNGADFLREFFAGLLPGDPLWVDLAMMLVNTVIILAIILTAALIGSYIERKVAGYMQLRPGPNRVGPKGWLQALADVLKMIGKEFIRPAKVDRWVWYFAPILLFVPTIASFAVIPFDFGAIFADLNIGILFFLSITSLSTLPFLMAGWGSNNKYSLIGGMRAVAQMVSYEIPLVFSLLGVVMLVGSMQMSDIVEAQSGIWFIFLQPVAFIVYLIAATAETNRAPFDLVEGESEIVAGPFTEYTGMHWGMFMLAEYGAMVGASAIATTLFLGGWNGPWLPGWVWFTLKTLLMVFVFMWFRWTFPRIRVDQLMSFGWKVLLPLALANVVVTGIGIYLYNMFA